MRPRGALPIPAWRPLPDAQTRAGNESSAIPPHATPCTTLRVVLWGPESWPSAEAVKTARAGRELETEASCLFRSAPRFLLRLELGQKRVASGDDSKGILTPPGKLIIFPARAVARNLPQLFPLAAHQGLFFQAAQSWIDGAAGQTRDFHHVKAVHVAGTDGFQDQG